MGLRRLLSRKVSVEAMIEFAMWLAIPYLIVGVVWAFAHAEFVQHRETELNKQLPAGANLVAFGESTVLWPFLLLAPDGCTTSGR
jgi:hypothetical protein